MLDLPNSITPVIVEWMDAYSIDQSWVDGEKINEEGVICKSVGWLLPQAKQGYVVIAQSQNSEEDYDGILVVPVGMVLRIIVVS
jgi:hypothetical protein